MKYPLNPAQKQAVEYTDGPLLIVAGAGTGKTTVITQKITYLIEDKLATPEQILALTFTEKAAGEMQTRVDEMLSHGYVDMQISTFHAFCQRILENHGLDIGLPNQFKLLTETDAWLLVRRNLDKFDLDYYRPLGNPARHIHELLKHFSKCKDELITPQEYLEYAEGLRLDKDSPLSSPRKRGSAPEVADSRFHGNDNVSEQKRLEEIADAYHVYNQLLLDNDALDFGDLIFYAIKLLRERPNILKLLQERYKYILVDEFQDVNWAQYQLVQMIVSDQLLPLTKGELEGVAVLGGAEAAIDGKPPVAPLGKGGRQLTVVGDDDQSIYAFRGASVSNILRFKKDYPGAKEVVLNENYRSEQEILDKAYALIQNNNPDRLEVKLKVDKKLIAKCHSDPASAGEESKNRAKDLSVASLPQDDKNQLHSVCHIHSATLDEEVKSVIDEIVRLKTENEKAAWDDFAVLVRANAHAEPFINAFEKQGIPYEYVASAGLFRQPIVLDCINFFKLMDNYHESTAWYRLLRLPFLQLSEEDLQKITAGAKRKTVSYYEVLKCAPEFQLSKDGLTIGANILSWINDGRQKARSQKPTVILVEWLEQSGYFKYLIGREQAGDRGALRAVRHLNQFLEYIAAYETANAGAHVSGFLEHLNYVSEAGDKGALYQITETPDSVNIMTVHAAKGLEFKYVFVVNLVEERFPTRARSEAIEIPEKLIKEQLPEGDEHIEEERRLFYVAMTRAKEKLYLTSADDYGGARTKKASRFLGEINLVANCHSEAKPKNLLTSGQRSFANAQDDKRQPSSEYFYPLSERFSYSQINSYSICPYQYKLANVLGIPTKGNANFSFGQSIHATLQKFYEKVRELNSAKQSSLFVSVTPAPGSVDSRSPGNDKLVRAPALAELLSIYERAWIGDWYESQSQREALFAEGKNVLKTFYENNEQSGWTMPVALEGAFRIKVGDYAISGRIDRIDQLPDGTLHIIDYKTGAGKDKLSSEDKDQLLIYQLAATSLPEFKNFGAVSKLTFYYLNKNSQISFIGNDEELAKIQDKIVKIIARIHSRDFAATPNPHICARCDFRDICEFRA